MNSEEDNNQNQDAGRRNISYIAHELCDELGIVTPQGERLLVEALKNVKLADDKQRDYGPHNILIGGALGIYYRCLDKLCRLKNLLREANDPAAVNEPISDTYRDLSNYGLIGLVLHNGDWLESYPEDGGYYDGQ